MFTYQTNVMEPGKKVIQGRQNGVIHFLKNIAGKIICLFEPEEVEVTFKVNGKKTSYTYKVTHK